MDGRAGRGGRAGAPVVKAEGLEEGGEGGVGALLALWEVAAVDDADLHDDPHEHGEHADDAGQDPPDEVYDEEVGRVPRPEHGVGEDPAPAEHDSVAKLDEEASDDHAQHHLEEDAQRGVAARREDGAVERAAGGYEEDGEDDEGGDVVLRECRRHDLARARRINCIIINPRTRSSEGYVCGGWGNRRAECTMPPNEGVELSLKLVMGVSLSISL